MAGNFNLKVTGVEALTASLSRTIAGITPAMVSSMEDAAQETKDIMQNAMPSRTGSLRASVSHEIDGSTGGVTAHIGPDDAEFEGRAVGRGTEFGKPAGGGFPNWFDIANRYGVSLGVGYAIAKSIQEKGSAGLFYAQRSIDTIRAAFYERGIQAIRQIANAF